MTGSPVEFFEELEQFTALWVERFIGGGIEPHSPWHSDQWSYGAPNGAVVHYTADPDPVRVMRWFLLEQHNARVSAHAVVLPAWTDELRELADGFHLVSTLPAPILQVVEPDKEAWHATWCNSWAYGIENVNAGQLQCRDGKFFWWAPRDLSAPQWTSLWNPKDGEPLPLFGAWWAPYPRPQVLANVVLLEKVNAFFDDGLEEPARVVGHEHVQANKPDPGPAYPIHEVRKAFFGQDYQALDAATVDLFHGLMWRDQKICDWYGLANPQKAWRRFAEDICSKQVVRTHWDVWGLLLLIFDLLGYHTGPAAGDASIRIFQRSAGLDADGIVGPLTWRALRQRLQLRGLVK